MSKLLLYCKHAAAHFHLFIKVTQQKKVMGPKSKRLTSTYNFEYVSELLTKGMGVKRFTFCYPFIQKILSKKKSLNKL